MTQSTESYWQRGVNDATSGAVYCPPVSASHDGHQGYRNGYRFGEAKIGALSDDGRAAVAWALKIEAHAACVKLTDPTGHQLMHGQSQLLRRLARGSN